MSGNNYGQRRMNNGREMEVIPYAGGHQATYEATYEAIKALREAEGVEDDEVCAHCDRRDQTHYPGREPCDCGPGGLWVPVEWAPILKMTINP